MTEKEKEFWEIFDHIRTYAKLSNEDVNDPIVSRHLKLMSNMIYFYRHQGVDKVKQAVRAKQLASLGIPVLQPKGKKR